MIIKCTCTHNFQDKKYGKGMRVCNVLAKTLGKTPEYRCTVCEKIHQRGGDYNRS